MGAEVITIAYVSAAVMEMTDDDIAAILTQARTNNERCELTGALLYRAGRFIQILEGPDEQVFARFKVIAADPRHRSIHIVSQEPIEERLFPEWTMGFRPLSDSAVKQLPGYEDYFEARTGRARLEQAENRSRQFLDWLIEYWFAPV
jgi:hypothetical protein